MLSDLTIDQKRLADLMSGISEKCWTAGWATNLEYVLWDALMNGERQYGRNIISQQEIQALETLSKACNCWIYFDDDTEETSIAIEEWEQKFKNDIFNFPEIING
jgi:hypothetical protein